MSAGPIDSVRAQLSRDRAMRAVVDAVLDRCDRTGALPGQMTLPCHSSDELEAATRLFSASAVRPGGGELVAQIDLARADARLRSEGWPGLCEVLYAASGRLPRNVRGETASLGNRAGKLAIDLANRRKGAAGSFLRAAAERLALCRGELFTLARFEGLDRLEKELDLTARCIELAEHNEGPLRLANFARRATGSTKALRAGDRRYLRVTDALLAHLPGLAERVAGEMCSEHSERRRLALECLNIFRNETPIDVLCWGRFALEKKGRRLDTPTIHYELGEACRLLLLHLREARVIEVRADRIISIENETTFNDYVECLQASGRSEIVLLSEGQANWAVVRLLRMLAEAAPSIPFSHWGDLDRFGVLILRSLRRRCGLDIQPLWMDLPTFERCAEAGLPLASGESMEIERLISASPGQVGSDLLRAICRADRWVEQEAVAEEVLSLSDGTGAD